MYALRLSNWAWTDRLFLFFRDSLPFLDWFVAWSVTSTSNVKIIQTRRPACYMFYVPCRYLAPLSSRRNYLINWLNYWLNASRWRSRSTMTGTRWRSLSLTPAYRTTRVSSNTTTCAALPSTICRTVSVASGSPGTTSASTGKETLV